MNCFFIIYNINVSNITILYTIKRDKILNNPRNKINFCINFISFIGTITILIGTTYYTHILKMS